MLIRLKEKIASRKLWEEAGRDLKRALVLGLILTVFGQYDRILELSHLLARQWTDFRLLSLLFLLIAIGIIFRYQKKHMRP